MLQQQVDLALDDPSNLSPTENPPRNEAISNINKDDPREFEFQNSLFVLNCT